LAAAAVVVALIMVFVTLYTGERTNPIDPRPPANTSNPDAE
jgi:hypothetical protein